MSDQNPTAIVSRESIIIAAYAQYCESNGGTHALVFNEKTNTLAYSPGGNYYDNDKISATEIMLIYFDDDADAPLEAVEFTEVVTNTVELNGTTYNLEIFNDEPPMFG